MGQRLHVASRIRNLLDGRVQARGKGDDPLAAPTSPKSASARHPIREADRRSSAQGYFFQFSAGGKPDPLAVGRKEGIERAFGSRNRMRLQTIHRPQVELSRGTIRTGGINQARAIRRYRQL